MAELKSDLADHVERSVDAIATVHREHAARARPLQRIIERVTALVARPGVIAALALVVLGWMAWNSLRALSGSQPVDPPPFAWLELTATLVGLGLVTLILATQRRENLLDEQRSQLILDLAIQSDQKTAKLVSLLEELRRDTPSIDDRIDPESEAMSACADTGTVLEEIQRRSGTETENPA